MMPKQQEGQLIWREGLGWYGRFYAIVEGERVRVARALHTENKAVARRKLTRLIAEGNVSPEEAQRPETFEEAARRIVDQQRTAGMATWKDRLYRLESYAFPRLGSQLPNSIKASHVRAALEELRDSGKSRQTLIHLKNDISVVLGDLWRAELLPENVCERVQVPEALPEAVERSKRERAVLTDEELVRYLAWEHPDERHRGAVLERQTMAAVARMFGGLRTSDLHAISWEHFDIEGGGFTWGIAPRRKGRRLSHGGKPQRLWVPEPLRPILQDWWQRAGRPSSGPVFPKRRGDGAGKETRVKSSHAKAFRRDLRRIFGLDVWDAERNAFVPAAGRTMTPRERTLLEETDITRPVDFHSWRRAFNQALADAGVNAQQAQALAGHSSLAAHERYLRNSQQTRTIPAAALPRVSIGHTAMGTLPESSRPAANDPGEIEQETPQKLAVGADNVALQAGCRRFKPCPAHEERCRIRDRVGEPGPLLVRMLVLDCRAPDRVTSGLRRHTIVGGRTTRFR